MRVQNMLTEGPYNKAQPISLGNTEMMIVTSMLNNIGEQPDD